MVGSRISTIVGASYQKDEFNNRICQAQRTGLTRLEVSICPGAMAKYDPTQVGVKTKWHSNMQSAMNQLVTGVLNHKSVTRQVYRKMNVPKMLASIGAC